MYRRLLFVINPVAVKRKKVSITNLVNEALNNLFEIDYLYWSSPEINLTQKVLEQLNTKEYDCVIAVGGDGTVNSIAQAIINRNEALLILPIGSGNGLARHLKLPMNLKKTLELVKHGKEVLIDCIKLSEGYSFCTTGVGFDAHVAHLFAKAGKRGLTTYVKKVFSSFFYYKSNSFILNCDGNEIVTRAFLITIANANQWGNNVKVSPKSSITDGLVNVIILKPFKWYQVPALAFRLLTGNFHKAKNVLTIKARKVHLKTTSQIIEGHFDGEPILFSQETNFECFSQCLKVLVPENSEI